MKKLDSKLYKYDKQQVDDLSKILGGEQVNTTWNATDGDGTDKADTSTEMVYIQEPGVYGCYKADIIKPEDSPVIVC